MCVCMYVLAKPECFDVYWSRKTNSHRRYVLIAKNGRWNKQPPETHDARYGYFHDAGVITPSNLTSSFDRIPISSYGDGDELLRWLLARQCEDPSCTDVYRFDPGELPLYERSYIEPAPDGLTYLRTRLSKGDTKLRSRESPVKDLLVLVAVGFRLACSKNVPLRHPFYPLLIILDVDLCLFFILTSISSGIFIYFQILISLAACLHKWLLIRCIFLQKLILANSPI